MQHTAVFLLQLKWSPILFGPRTFLVPDKFGPQEIVVKKFTYNFEVHIDLLFLVQLV